VKVIHWLLLALSAWGFNSAAMTVEAHGNTVFATGPVVDDLRKFEDAFAKGGIDTVVFVNSPGGDLWTGLRVGRLIADKGYKTVIAGHCVSACSIMYMGGKERRFSDAARPGLTYIGIHGAHDAATKTVNPQLQPQIYAFYKQYMGEKFNSAIMNQALYEMDDAGSLLVVRDPVRSPRVEAVHCRSAQTPRDRCTRFAGETALSLGIVTHADLAKVTLPAAFRTEVRVLGRELTAESDDLPLQLQKIAAAQCPTDPCRDNVVRHFSRPEHRAIAVAMNGKGVGWGPANADTPDTALLRAVYACNHPAAQPARLCEAELVNSYPVRHLYAESDASHQQALTVLKAPVDKFYASEEFGGGFSKATAYRTEKLSDITPQSLEGVTTVGTQDLARMLTGPQRPVVVDVAAFFDTIPGAVVLAQGGAAHADAIRDEAVHKRFALLLALLAPDKTAPVVFFCHGRNCWTSVNAALRARNAGYTQVAWYRGGMEAWKAAGLPTAIGVVRAVVQ
jgi:PQQ-dependent catabolism-associated CXXCW motif protein